MERTMMRTAYAMVATGCWLVLGWLVFVLDVGSKGSFDRASLAAYVLLFLAPLLTFVPAARRLRAPLYDLEALAGWASFGYVVTFLAPDAPASLAAVLIFLLPLTVALATLAAPLAYLIGLRVLRGDPRRHDFLRARREGYLFAIFVVSLLLLHGIEVLTAANGALLLAICVLAEALILVRGDASGQPVSSERQLLSN